MAWEASTCSHTELGSVLNHLEDPFTSNVRRPTGFLPESGGGQLSVAPTNEITPAAAVS